MDLAAIVENKHLDAALAMAKLIQEQLPARKRNLSERRRRSQGAHMFPDPQPPAGEPVKRQARSVSLSPTHTDRSDAPPVEKHVRGPAALAAGPGFFRGQSSASAGATLHEMERFRAPSAASDSDIPSSGKSVLSKWQRQHLVAQRCKVTIWATLEFHTSQALQALLSGCRTDCQMVEKRKAVAE